MITLLFCVGLLVIGGGIGAMYPAARAAIGTLVGLGIIVSLFVGLCVNSVKEDSHGQ